MSDPIAATLDKIQTILRHQYQYAHEYELRVELGLLWAVGVLDTLRDLDQGNFADPDSVDPNRAWRDVLEGVSEARS